LSTLLLKYNDYFTRSDQTKIVSGDFFQKIIILLNHCDLFEQKIILFPELDDFSLQVTFQSLQPHEIEEAVLAKKTDVQNHAEQNGRANENFQFPFNGFHSTMNKAATSVGDDCSGSAVMGFPCVGAPPAATESDCSGGIIN
jgi:hypothetical protein